MSNLKSSDLQKDLDFIFSPAAIRSRSQELFAQTKAGKGEFIYNPQKLEETVEFVIKVIFQNYPDLNIPVHSRWGHFQAQQVDRLAILQQKLGALSKLDQALAKFDLALVSVLLDAGAGERWMFNETSTGKKIGRSEGLAVASFWMFLQGEFSHDPQNPFQASSSGLQSFTQEKLTAGFQVSESNPLTGVEGRTQLLQSLGKVIASRPQIFVNQRPSGLILHLLKKGNQVQAVEVLRLILDNLGPIWPSRLSLNDVPLGDVWSHPLVGEGQGVNSLVPFHKLSQWLTYSLFQPIEEAGIQIKRPQDMTGLPEYRNGGLLVDMGLLVPKQASDLQKEHKADSPFIVEWRAATIVLLDEIGKRVCQKLNKSEEEFPLAKVLEGGTWWAGRNIAKQHRADGTPPIKLKSDGTVF